MNQINRRMQHYLSQRLYP